MGSGGTHPTALVTCKLLFKMCCVLLPEELSLALQRGGVVVDSQMAVYNCLFFKLHSCSEEFI